LGLCEMRRGHKPEAIRASLTAVRHGDLKTRLNAYFNLWKLGVSIPLAETSDRCEPLKAMPELACTASTSICRCSEYLGGNGGGVSLSRAHFPALGDVSRKRVDRCTDEDPFINTTASFWRTTKNCDFAWGFRPPAADAVLERCKKQISNPERCEHLLWGAYCDAVNCSDQEAIKDARAVGLKFTRAERDALDQAEKKCLQANDAEIAATQREWDWRAGPCTPIVADPCRGFVGLVCRRAVPGPARYFADELSREGFAVRGESVPEEFEDP
ncbi:MAG: hypothetical protein WBV82_32340, partial [Myxococcaceae bacterium]